MSGYLEATRNENSSLRKEFFEVKFQLKASKHVTTELETNDSVAEAKLYQHYKDT